MLMSFSRSKFTLMYGGAKVQVTGYRSGHRSQATGQVTGHRSGHRSHKIQ